MKDMPASASGSPDSPGPSAITSPQPSGNPLTRLLTKVFRRRGALDCGLQDLDEQLGLSQSRGRIRDRADVTIKSPTQELARGIIYAPDMDGQADPGEVVWADICTNKLEEPERRAVLIIGRKHHTLVTLLISSEPEHEGKDNWISIGSGPWDEDSAQSWARLDKSLLVSESHIQRRGVSMPERRFDRIASRLRRDYGWH